MVTCYSLTQSDFLNVCVCGGGGVLDLVVEWLHSYNFHCVLVLIDWEIEGMSIHVCQVLKDPLLQNFTFYYFNICASNLYKWFGKENIQ